VITFGPYKDVDSLTVSHSQNEEERKRKRKRKEGRISMGEYFGGMV
jgi:hypothetical protein